MSRISAQFDQAIARIDEEQRRLEDGIKFFLTKVAEFTVERAVPNAPILTGDLRAALSRTEVVRTSEGFSVKVIDTMPYALVMHENLFPFGMYNLGPISRQQPGTAEGGVGGKYIERVVQYHLERFQTAFQDIINRFGLTNASITTRFSI